MEVIVGDIAKGLADRYEGSHTSLSLPSTRVDAFNVDLANELSRNGRRSGLTFAPEGVSERIRRVINKGVTEEDLARAFGTNKTNISRAESGRYEGLTVERFLAMVEGIRALGDRARTPHVRVFIIESMDADDVYNRHGEGVALAEMLNILEGFDIRALGHNSPDYLHVVSEAKRIAFADHEYAAARRHELGGAVRAPHRPVAVRVVHLQRAAARRTTYGGHSSSSGEGSVPVRRVRGRVAPRGPRNQAPFPPPESCQVATFGSRRARRG